jgi:plastocyanin
MVFVPRLAAPCALGLLVLLGACGGGYSSTQPGPPTPPVAAATVKATPQEQFTPGTVNLTVGGTVTFDFESLAHDVYFDNAPAGAPANITAPTANATVTRTFATAGRYAYNCHLHPGMSGVIVVQ